MYIGKGIVAGLMLAGSVAVAEVRSPFGAVEIQESIRVATEKFSKDKGKEIAESVQLVTAKRSAKGATVILTYEEQGKEKVYSIPCHQHRAGDIDCH